MVSPAFIGRSGPMVSCHDDGSSAVSRVGTNSTPNRTATAPALERKTVPSPKPSRARTVRYRPAPVMARSTPGSARVVRMASSAGRNAWKARYAARHAMIPITTVVAASTSALAVSSRWRCGTAASVARIMPLPYSLVTASTPSRPTAIWDKCRPPRLTRTESMAAFWCALRWPGRKTPSSAAVTTLNITAASSAQNVERTVPSLRASDRRTPANSGTRPAGGGGAVVVAGMGGSLLPRRGRLAGCGPVVGPVVGSVPGELHVPVLEGGLLRGQPGEGEPARTGKLADRLGGGPGDGQGVPVLSGDRGAARGQQRGERPGL